MEIQLDTLARVIDQAWKDDYPPELEPWQVKGRKMWRKKHLVRLILTELGPAYPSEIQDFVTACGELE